MSDDSLIDDQVAYYRARAAEYDTTTMPHGDPHAPYADATRAALRAFEPRGDVLELAAGTGQWTSILGESAASLTCVDASPEIIDLVFFGFWLSHVPPGRFETFWKLVERSLARGGRVFFVDEGDHDTWDEDWTDREAGIVRRRLTDGSEHLAVKVLWRAEDLETRLRELGWQIAVQATGPFYWGGGVRSR